MLSVYLLRHGETTYNADGNRYCGRTDTSLTNKGIKQAVNVFNQLKDEKFDAVYSSPLSRACLTAQIATESKEVQTDQRIIEVDFGTWEGKTKEEFINADEKKKIAKAAIELIGQTDSIMIGSGTTVFELARMLHPTKHLTVITPALKVGLELSNRPNVEVLQLGGLIRQNSSSVAGAHAMSVLDEISCSILFLGVDGIDIDFGITISNISEATLNQKNDTNRANRCYPCRQYQV